MLELVLVLVLVLLAACGAPRPTPVAPPIPRPEPATVVVRGEAFDPDDRDADGVADAYDLCPTLGEDGKGPHPWDGCPDDHDPSKRMHAWGPPPRDAVEVTHDQIKIGEEILFASSSVTIDPSSMELIQSIAQVIKDAPEIEFVEVAGHADDEGSDDNNKRLTAQRALSVVNELAKRGIDRALLRAAGYSSYCPIDKGADVSAKAKNRRVEFRILRRNGLDLEPNWAGCDEARKHGMKPLPLPPKKRAHARAPVRKADPRADPECGDGQPMECRDRCDRGDAEACEGLASALGYGRVGIAKGPGADPERAFAALARACDLGRLEACPRVADALRDGAGTAKDPKRAEAVLEKACASGSAPACDQLGKAFHAGSFGTPDETKAAGAYEKACDLGDGEGCQALGKALWFGYGVKEDRARALDRFISACELGRSGCATLRDRMKDDPKSLQSRGRALASLHVACEQDGDAAACSAVRAMHEKPGEYKPAPVCSAGDFTACRKACEKAKASDACLELGLALLYGTGARRKPDDAQALFAEACRAGAGRGCSMSALVREASTTQGGAHEERVAVDEYESACSLGASSGCVNRARMELEGIGTYRDEARATKAMDLACAKNVGIACAHLGRIALRGLGAPADPARATSLFRKACEAGFHPACTPPGPP